ncbi:NADP-dependent isocitrate dehydrogenase [Mailhella massiliensis]|uniref:NADP-dependent isocitrate dehydrogenase n=1 Tax=Mailhella massiliensis TaxID=1903261 RepID=UPI00097D1BA6|nr:NADP-dependent isocitrate dehydrogenase [Mailhella massiliensis]
MKHTVYWIEGDGIGPEIWNVTRPVLDAAMKAATSGEHEIEWIELLAGEKAMKKTGSPLPQETLDTLGRASVAIKGPLGTPVGGGIRSLNVAMRQAFDLYACIRPVSWFQGISTPVKHPELVNMVIFRENTEDVYAGIEYQAGTPEAEKLGAFLRSEFGAKVREGSALGIKPMSAFCSKRLVRSAIRYAIDHKLPSVTLVHKGNIMKFTEGGFRAWGYEVAREEFGDITIPEKEATPENSRGKIIIKDRIADAMFQEALLHPDQYSVLALPNLNGDYISDALAAQVGGLGMAPGVNMSDRLALFEATHGTAPTAAGKDIANPGSLLLSGALMLEHMGFAEAADKVRSAILAAIASKTVTPDLAAEMPGAQAVSCSKFGEILLKNIH